MTSPEAGVGTGWTATHKWLHWTIAVALVAQVALGVWFEGMAREDPLRAAGFRAHATLGFALLAAMIVRLAWRRSHPVPPLPDTLAPWQKRTARITHGLLYAIVIAMPIGGWLLVSSGGGRPPLLGMRLPAIAPASEALEALFWYLHVGGAVVLAALVALHAGAALRHALVLRDDVLARMLPRGKR